MRSLWRARAARAYGAPVGGRGGKIVLAKSQGHKLSREPARLKTKACGTRRPIHLKSYPNDILCPCGMGKNPSH